jgi:hypothetical protein
MFTGYQTANYKEEFSTTDFDEREIQKTKNEMF